MIQVIHQSRHFSVTLKNQHRSPFTLPLHFLSLKLLSWRQCLHVKAFQTPPTRWCVSAFFNLLLLETTDSELPNTPCLPYANYTWSHTHAPFLTFYYSFLSQIFFAGPKTFSSCHPRCSDKTQIILNLVQKNV